MKRTTNCNYIAALILSLIFFVLSTDYKTKAGVLDDNEHNSITSEAKENVVQELTGSIGQPDWPCFHGSNHQNKSEETGLMKSWPEGGPELLWTVSGLGEGYASVSIAEGRLFTSGTSNDQTYVFAYDLDGKLIWKIPNGTAWKVEVSWARSYNGSRSTPTYDNGMVYHLSEASRLAAYDAKTGKEIWSRNLMKDFDADMPDYGFTESILVEGNKLFVRPAGKKGFQVCLDKLTGKTVWINNEIPGTNSYSSGVLKDFGGYRQIVSNSSNCYYGIDTETGKLLWRADFANSYEVNATDAVIINEYIIMSNGLGGGSELIKLKTTGSEINTERVWKTDLMDNYHGGIIYHDGYFYGSGDRNRGWFCIELNTGKQMWKETKRMGSLTFADGMLYLYEENGTMKLVKAAPEKFEISGEFKMPRGGGGPYWAHPVVCGGRLYLRHSDKLFVYDIGNQQ